MRVAYVAVVDLPNRYAHAIQVVKNAQAWAKASDEFEFITNVSPKNWRGVRFQRLADFYGLTHPFPIVTYPFGGLLHHPWSPLRGLFFYPLAARRCQKQGVDLVYTRTYLLPKFTVPKGILTIAETHSPPENTYDKRTLYAQTTHPEFLALVTISEPLAERYRAFGIPAEKIIALPDGVDLERFENPLDKATARTKLNLAIDDPLAVYVGHLYRDRGVEDILTAAQELPDVRFLLVGGHGRHLAKWRLRAHSLRLSNLSFTGFVSNHQVPTYLWAADVLLMPYSAACYTAEWMSPLKLFEYMAAGRPIVASALPALKTVLTHDQNAWLCAPDDGEALAEAVSLLARSPALGQRLAHQALQDAEQYSWDNRVAKILDFTRHRLPA